MCSCARSSQSTSCGSGRTTITSATCQGSRSPASRASVPGLRPCSRLCREPPSRLRGSGRNNLRQHLHLRRCPPAMHPLLRGEHHPANVVARPLSMVAPKKPQSSPSRGVQLNAPPRRACPRSKTRIKLALTTRLSFVTTRLTQSGICGDRRRSSSGLDQERAGEIQRPKCRVMSV